MTRDEPMPGSRIVWFAAPALLLMLFAFALPLGGILAQSLTAADGSGVSTHAYAKVLSTELFWRVSWITVKLSGLATLIAVLLAYPVAYFLAGLTPRRRTLLLVFVLVPFWTSVIVKTFAFTVLLGQSGLINSMLAAAGMPKVKLLFNSFGVMIGMAHFLVPFMVFPIMTNLLKQPKDLKQAAAILGAGKWHIFTRVTMPLSLPAVIAGALMSFILAMGSFVVPALLGGRSDMMIGNLIDFYVRETVDWAVPAAMSVLLVALVCVIFLVASRLPGGGSMLGEAER